MAKLARQVRQLATRQMRAALYYARERRLARLALQVEVFSSDFSADFQ